MSGDQAAVSGATAGGGAAGARSTLEAVGGLNPEWRSWLELLEATLDALDEPVWAAAAPESPVEGRPADAPLLHGTTLALDARPARRWVRRLTKAAARQADPGAASLAGLRFHRLDVHAYLEAAIAQDSVRMEALAGEAGAQPAALAAVAQLAVRPLLLACGRRLAAQVPASWSHGYCPICGAWPALAEVRGIDRSRRLRCGRCGGDWRFSVLRCPYCDEKDHAKQGSLVPEGEEEVRKVDTCRTCSGYVKAVTTLRAIEAPAVLVEDLATVELDIAALERGYARPERPAYALEVHLTDARRRPLVRSGGGR